MAQPAPCVPAAVVEQLEKEVALLAAQVRRLHQEMTHFVERRRDAAARLHPRAREAPGEVPERFLG